MAARSIRVAPSPAAVAPMVRMLAGTTAIP